MVCRDPWTTIEISDDLLFERKLKLMIVECRIDRLAHEEED